MNAVGVVRARLAQEPKFPPELSVHRSYRGPSTSPDRPQASDPAPLRMTGLPGCERGALPGVFSYADVNEIGIPGLCAYGARVGGVGRGGRGD